MTRTLSRAALAATLALTGSAAMAQLAVIVNPKSPAATMTAEQVAAIFMGKTSTLPWGSTAAMADQAEGGPLHEQFYAKVAGKTGPQVKAAWSRLTFSGKANPPRPLAGSAEVRKFVAANPDAIGYVEAAAVDASVKTVLTID